MLSAKQESNKILLQRRNKNKIRLWQENIPKMMLNKLKVMGFFFFYLYPLGI
jgi:hypothetical protein